MDFYASFRAWRPAAVTWRRASRPAVKQARKARKPQGRKPTRQRTQRIGRARLNRSGGYWPLEHGPGPQALRSWWPSMVQSQETFRHPRRKPASLLGQGGQVRVRPIRLILPA